MVGVAGFTNKNKQKETGSRQGAFAHRRVSRQLRARVCARARCIGDVRPRRAALMRELLRKASSGRCIEVRVPPENGSTVNASQGHQTITISDEVAVLASNTFRETSRRSERGRCCYVDRTVRQSQIGLAGPLDLSYRMIHRRRDDVARDVNLSRSDREITANGIAVEGLQLYRRQLYRPL